MTAARQRPAARASTQLSRLAKVELLAELRERIGSIERRPPRRAAFEPTGLAELNAQLPGGGLPRGLLSEIAGAPGSGKTALCLSAMARAMGAKGLAAFVDGRGELYPPAAEALGIDLARLLIVRPGPHRPSLPLAANLFPAGRAGRDALAALWSAEALLASGAFGLVAMDIPVPAGGPAPATAFGEPEERGGWGRAPVLSPGRFHVVVRRLAAAAERGGAVGLWLAAPGELRAAAAVRIEVERGPDGTAVRLLFARGAAEWSCGAGAGGTPGREREHAG